MHDKKHLAVDFSHCWPRLDLNWQLRCKRHNITLPVPTVSDDFAVTQSGLIYFSRTHYLQVSVQLENKNELRRPNISVKNESKFFFLVNNCKPYDNIGLHEEIHLNS